MPKRLYHAHPTVQPQLCIHRTNKCATVAVAQRFACLKLHFRYIRERDLDWAWWSLDGEQGPSRQLKGLETYGLLNTRWNGPAYQPLVDHLKSLG